MEWGGGSTSSVTLGTGLNQTEAGRLATDLISRGVDTTLRISRIGPAPDGTTNLQLAFANLSLVPPSDYEKADSIPESFVLAAFSGLVRVSKMPLNFLAASLLRAQRKQLTAILQSGGEFTVEQFVIRGSPGCMEIEDRVSSSWVFVKTPFALSNRC